ncbi:MAG: hypothetical protein AB9891_05725 [Anaerolineaceae bacterium]
MNHSLIALLILSVFSQACTSTAVSVTPEATPSLGKTPSSTPEQASTSTPEKQDYLQINHAGIKFMLDKSISPGVRIFKGEIESPDGQAGHYTHFSLAADRTCQSGCIQVYSVEDFESSYGGFVFPPAGYGGGAAVIFSAGEEKLNFQNGDGTRALEVHGQMTGYAFNGALSYVYRGFTNDGRYAVYIEIPITASILPASADTKGSSDPKIIPIPTLATGRTNYVESVDIFNKQAALELAILPDSEFTPRLDYLDALAASIQIVDP